MTTEQFTPLDMAFLCLERHAAPMHMGAVAVFEPSTKADPERFASLLGQRARRLLQLRRNVRQSWLPPGACFWAEDPDFDLGHHVVTHQMVTPGGQGELGDLTSRIIAEPLDMTRPLWQLHLITGLEADRFAVVAKFHHALCDGAGAIALGVGLMDGFTPQDTPDASDENAQPSWFDTAQSAWRLLAQPDKWLSKASGFASGLPDVLRQAGRMIDIASAVARSARLPVADSPLISAPSENRRVELLRLDLQDVQRVRKRHGGTDNDVLLAVVTGALRRWLTARGYPVDDLSVRALIPVSQRVRSVDAAGGNRLSGHLCDLPVGERDPSARLRRIRESMHHNKTAGPHKGAGAIPLLAQQLPHAAHRVAMPIAGRGAPLLFDTIVTNVPLPRIPLSFDGARLHEMYPLVPLAPGHTLGVAVSRYQDAVHIGLQVNGDALPDMEKLSEAVPAALAELTDLTIENP
jgi:WS/DGAT/MGAT family acyltransferase